MSVEKLVKMCCYNIYRASSSLVFNSTPVTGSFGGYDINKDEARNARVLYDFESEDDSGLSVNSDQVRMRRDKVAIRYCYK